MGGRHSKEFRVRAASSKPRDTSSSEEDEERRARVEFAKRVIEVYYDELFIRHEQRELERNELERGVQQGLMSEKSKKLRLHEQFVKELEYVRNRRRPLTVRDFQVLEKIGQGSYGKVYLVRQKDTGELFAMKKLNKEAMISRRQVAHVWLERFVLATTGECPYVVKMFYSLQDRDNLYFLMEFLPGGDLLGLLTRENIVSENCARFYIAEIVVAIDSLHRTGLIHRDVKCDNIIFDANGHVRLSDFGLSKSLLHHFGKRMSFNEYRGRDLPNISSGYVSDHTRHSFSHSRRLQAGLANLTVGQRAVAWKAMAREEVFSAVGTPNYIAPEVLVSNRYNESCDWWSVGCILFEMLVGYPPFWSQSPETTLKMIAHWDQYFVIPDPPKSKLSKDAIDLICRLICDQKYRLGARRGLEEFKEHPFFEGIPWDNLMEMTPPFVPQLSCSTDTKYFDVQDTKRKSKSTVFDEVTINVSAEFLPGLYDAPLSAMKHVRNVRKLRRVLNTDLDFVGFSFTGHHVREYRKPAIPPARPQSPVSPREVTHVEVPSSHDAEDKNLQPNILPDVNEREAARLSVPSAGRTTPIEEALEDQTKTEIAQEVSLSDLKPPDATLENKADSQLQRQLHAKSEEEALSPITLTDLSDNGEEDPNLGTGAGRFLLETGESRSEKELGLPKETSILKKSSVSPLAMQRRRSERFRKSRDLRQSLEMSGSPPGVDAALIEMDVPIPSTQEITKFVDTAKEEINAAAAVLDAPEEDRNAVAQEAKLNITNTAAELAATISAESSKENTSSSTSFPSSKRQSPKSNLSESSGSAKISKTT